MPEAEEVKIKVQEKRTPAAALPDDKHIKTTSKKPQILVYREGEQPPLPGVDHRSTQYAQDKSWSHKVKEEPKFAGTDQLRERLEVVERKLDALVDMLREKG